MSNRNPAGIAGRRKPKVSLAMDISQGLGGPKLHPVLLRDSSDGQTVNIPSLQHFLMGGRSSVVRVSYWIGILGLRMSAW